MKSMLLRYYIPVILNHFHYITPRNNVVYDTLWEIIM